MSETDPDPAGTGHGSPRRGPPPLRPFGLVLHHDGTFTHEGQPITNRRLREHFERHVEYLPDERKYVVRLQHFRGEVEVEEAGFFVRGIDFDGGDVWLSDGSREPLDLTGLEASPIDGVLLCRVKRSLAPEGLRARFSHAAQAELLNALELRADGLVIELAGEPRAFPEIAGFE